MLSLVEAFIGFFNRINVFGASITLNVVPGTWNRYLLACS